MSVKQTDTPVAEHLRAIRGADDVISRLRENSIAGKSDRIAEALGAEPRFANAKLNGVYGKITLALATNERGETFQVKVQEDNENIVLGKVSVCGISVPVQDVAEESAGKAGQDV